jgi:superfamily II DNA/RNA helicase
MPKDESHRSSRRHGRHRDRDAPYHKDESRRRKSSDKDRDEDEFGRSKSSRHRHHNHESDRPSSNDTSPCPTFDSMNLKPALLRGIYAYGFEKPSAIQQRAIRPIVRGRDVIAQSQSGTGKTAVFSISALQLLDERSSEPQVLILSPIRELAEQTQRVVSSLGDFMNVKAIACIGGKSLGEDRKMLQQGVQVISGTPGRVYDLIKRGDLRTRSLKAFIIDEADEMLNKGFKEQVSEVFLRSKHIDMYYLSDIN